MSGSESHGMMEFSVFTPFHDLQIFNSVIRFYAVNVVDNFRRREFASDMLLHYFSMLRYLFSVFSRHKIAVMMQRPSGFEPIVILSGIEFFEALERAKMTFIRFNPRFSFNAFFPTGAAFVSKTIYAPGIAAFRGAIQSLICLKIKTESVKDFTAYFAKPRINWPPIEFFTMFDYFTYSHATTLSFTGGYVNVCQR